ncbi:putative ABC transport system ATP-binding protein [Hathewaya proteolytica DSM 3090]|uniref:Putative ABC transport system ATP-binding protein n=1 Tax=Hathewaya proteolytica DSM 3090 TaxID=1121331 RepID=A0A1M6ME20_9CLOT|nr:ATP-binding cassette domain-containing protein [Hathewaya proteolytica]SHJ81543.1 putative ABC transport system ATP-binding protein [Hathewaya proteolytica DSM 3090]
MLRVDNLHKTFNKGTVNENKLFSGVNLHVEKGDFITLIGSNGAGKSTLLNVIAGAIPLDYGKITLDGKDISKLKEYKINQEIARVYQDPTKGTAPSMTILENMSMAYNKGKGFGLSSAINKSNTDYFKTLLEPLNLGLEDKIHNKVGLLSGGQRQALALIMAVMNAPKLLLLDEHTAALDPKTSEKIIEISNKVVQEKNITTLMVTHNLRQAIDIGNRLIMMHRGEIVVDVAGEEKKNLTVDKVLQYFEKNSSGEGVSDRMLFA